MFKQIQVLFLFLIMILYFDRHLTFVRDKRRRTDFSKQTIQKAMNNSHIVITTDVSNKGSPEINVPIKHIEEMLAQINRMGRAKIQFGVEAEYQHENVENTDNKFT